MSESGNCYVYVYIDPRNYEEFYYGKGRGSRKSAHLSEDSDSEKVRRIAAIKRARLDPIIRVVARGLTDDQALLIEKTLLWKLGRHLTNVSTGHFVQHFRPHDTLHKLISGFDYESGVYYYNIGEGPHRNWDDYLEFGFISAGQGVRRRDAMLGFHEGDVIAAYLKRRGFVGIGRIASSAKPIREVKLQGKALLSHQLRCTNMDDNVESNDLCEYVSRVEWIKTVDRAEAYMIRKAGIFTTQLVRASLEGQPATITFLNQAFGLRIRDYIL